MVLAADGPAVPRDAALPNGGAVRTQAASIAELIIDLQARGMRVEVPIERRQGGAGPSDSGMLWIGGFPVTVPTDNALAQSSPYVLAAEDDGYAVYRDGERSTRLNSSHVKISYAVFCLKKKKKKNNILLQQKKKNNSTETK